MNDPRNREVAERVLGWIAWVPDPDRLGEHHQPDHYACAGTFAVGCGVSEWPDFLNDDRAFGMLLDEVARQGAIIRMDMQHYPDTWLFTVIRFDPNVDGHGKAADRRTALVEAVLAAYRAKEGPA